MSTPRRTRARAARRGNGGGSLFRRSPSGPWVARYFDGRGVRRERSTRTTSRADAERIMRGWIERAALEREGLASPEGGTDLDRHARAPLAEHLEAFTTAKRAEGRAAKTASDTAEMIRRTAEACGWRTLADIAPDKLERHIARRRSPDDGSRPWTPRTAAKCIGAWRTFLRWCIRDGRLEADPLARLRKPAPHRQRSRRFLSVDEWRWLRAVTERAPARFGLSGPERALCYALALETGLRASELARLTRASLALDGGQPHVMLNASQTKARKAARQYVRPALADELRSHAARMLPGAPLLAMPPSTETTRMLRADLADARAAWIDDAGDDAGERIRREGSDFLAAEDHDGRVLDFHALRHTCGAWAAMGGASPKAVQTLMRHSTITLTLDTYGHLLPDEAAQTVARMPEAEPLALRLTGTDDDDADEPGAPPPAAQPTRTRNGTDQCDGMQYKTAFMTPKPHGPVAELVDAADLKSAGE